MVIDKLFVVFMNWNNVSLQFSGEILKFKQLQNIMRNGFMIDGKLSFNIVTDIILTYYSH